MRRRTILSSLAAATLAVAGCQLLPGQQPAGEGSKSSASAQTSRPAPLPVSQLLRRPGGFYNDDAPDSSALPDLDSIADAVPRSEPMNERANEPYTVFGREYLPYRALVTSQRQGTISWYGRKFHGQRTWSGEIYDMYAMTAAHPTLPIPSYARVRNLENGRAVVVRINDRGPFHSGRIMDVSYAAAHRLGFATSGAATVEVEAILPSGTQARPAERPAPAPKVAATETPEPAPVVTATAEASGVYLQLGAFGSSANAESFRNKVLPQLAELKLTAQVALQTNLYRVHVGPFRNRSEAGQTAEKLRETLGIRPVFVVR